MNMKKIIIDQEIFDRFPDFKRGIIIVSDFENALRNKSIKKLLDKEIMNRIGTDWLEHELARVLPS